MRLSPHPFTLRQIQYLIAVAEQRSFRKAAELCHVAQPSLSSQIQHLEEALGLTLFERGPRQVILTEAGARVVEQARLLLVGADDILRACASFADPFCATLRLGVIPSAGPYLLPSLSKGIRDTFPKLSLQWIEDRTAVLTTKLESGELDGALLALESEIGTVDHAVIGKDPFVLAVPKHHRLSRGKAPVAKSALAGEQMLLLEDGHCFRDQALNFCSTAGIQEMAYRATSFSTLTQMIAGGTAITLLPEVSLAVENRQGDLVVRRLAAPEPSRTLALCWRPRSALRPALIALAAQMRKSFQALQSGS